MSKAVGRSVILPRTPTNEEFLEWKDSVMQALSLIAVPKGGIHDDCHGSNVEGFRKEMQAWKHVEGLIKGAIRERLGNKTMIDLATKSGTAHEGWLLLLVDIDFEKDSAIEAFKRSAVLVTQFDEKVAKKFIGVFVRTERWPCTELSTARSPRRFRGNESVLEEVGKVVAEGKVQRREREESERDRALVARAAGPEKVQRKAGVEEKRGRSQDGTVNRGFGFVEFLRESEAQAAIKGCESKIIGGRQVFANIARPKAGEGKVGGGGAKEQVKKVVEDETDEKDEGSGEDTMRLSQRASS
ncbi:hypothetical protein BC829DRAFT_447361 [Chytridium lagenaria]|nr:hypothetical protein BC829DRAFT_447361 [Chytridium lagenaria]